MANDDIFYQQVADELSRNELDPALMAKATGKSLGDKNLAQSLYIELRVEKLKQELAVRLAADEATRRAKDAAQSAEALAQRTARNMPDSDQTDWAKQPLGTGFIGIFIAGLVLVFLVMLMASC